MLQEIAHILNMNLKINITIVTIQQIRYLQG